MVSSPPVPILKLIVFTVAPAVEFDEMMACLRLPDPLSFTFVTVYAESNWRPSRGSRIMLRRCEGRRDLERTTVGRKSDDGIIGVHSSHGGEHTRCSERRVPETSSRMNPVAPGWKAIR